ncbi:MAG: putative addiction module antidote protein [Moraxella sp.]|nr:putative addiction module antidote protein [Moraxella sp.]
MNLTKFNAFDYLNTDDEILDFLNDCHNDEDPRIFTTALSHLVDKKGVKEVSKMTGLNCESLYKTIYS